MEILEINKTEITVDCTDDDVIFIQTVKNQNLTREFNPIKIKKRRRRRRRILVKQANDKHLKCDSEDEEIILCKNKSNIEVIDIANDENSNEELRTTQISNQCANLSESFSIVSGYNDENLVQCDLVNDTANKRVFSSTINGTSSEKNLTNGLVNDLHKQCTVTNDECSALNESNNDTEATTSGVENVNRYNIVQECLREKTVTDDDVIFDCVYSKPPLPSPEFWTVAAISVDAEEDAHADKSYLRSVTTTEILNRMLPSSVPGLATLYVASENLLPLNIKPSQCCYYFRINSNIEIQSVSKIDYYRFRSQLIKPPKYFNRIRGRNYKNQVIPRLCCQVKNHCELLKPIGRDIKNWSSVRKNENVKMKAKKSSSVWKSNWNGSCFPSVGEWLNSKLVDPVHYPLTFKKMEHEKEFFKKENKCNVLNPRIKTEVKKEKQSN